MTVMTDTPAGRALLTLLIGAAGAGIAWGIGAPIPVLLGPAILVSIAGLAGAPVEIDGALRDICFIVLGVVVGSGFDAQAVGAMQRWPLAFAVVAALVFAILTVCRACLVAGFGFDRRSALLAAAPGHLSFVIAVASDTGSDVARISVTQSVRLLLLTLVVPFIALLLGVELGNLVPAAGATMAPWVLLVVGACGYALGRLFLRLRVPAPLLMGAMVVSAAGHATGVVVGAVPALLLLPAYLVLGCLIGTRFRGITLQVFLSSLGAGIAVATIGSVLALIAAVPVALALGMPLAHLLVAFAPGGLETMIAIGTMLAVVPGFVAACHVMRLAVLSVLLPVMVGRD